MMADPRAMILGILPEQGGSIAGLRRSGQDRRFIEQYLKRYVSAFEAVHYFSYMCETLDVPGADNFHLHPNPGWHRWIYTFALPFVYAGTFRRCAVLRVMQATGAIPARLARLLYGVPFVVTYGYHYSTELRATGRRLRAWLFDRRALWALHTADGIIVTTQALADYVSRFAPPNRIALIPNSVDTERFSPAVAAKPAEGRRCLIAVGSLTANKNHRLLIEAAALTGRRDLDVVILGCGEEEARLRELAAAKGVSLQLPGIVPNDVLPEHLRRADLYLITSLSEGHPKSLLEAMSVGLPCIGTNVRGIRDVLKDGETGRLVAPDAGELAKAISELLSDPSRAQALGTAARRHILEHYDAQAVMEQEIAFLKDVARGKLRDK
ncbi:MAG: glycosyltransferase family 4 protein [Candidatus Sumerlaeia bacterium]|nr:glycosyltransferase family 4 protein [Candidatus Sumerlaeia bacterium]